MSSDPTICLLRNLVGFLQTKEVIHFFEGMEERIMNNCVDMNSTTSVHYEEDVDYCSLPYPDRHKVATAVLNLSRAETSSSPVTRAQARRGIERLPGTQRQPKLLPRMHRRFLKSKPSDGGPRETDSQVNEIGSDVGGELRVKPVVGLVPESMLEEDDGCTLEINLRELKRMGTVEEEEDHTKSGTKPQLRDLNFVLIDTEQDTVRTMNEMMNQGTTCWYHPHQESYTLLRPRASRHSTQHVASSGFDRGTHHEVQPHQQNLLVQRAGEDVVAITMHPQSADSEHILKITDTLHDFTFPTATSCQPNQGWGSARTEDYLQLACIPVCTKNLGFGGGNSLPPAVTSGAGGAVRPHGKSPVDIFMERGPADLRNVSVNTLNPANGQPGTIACSCPVHAGFRWNTAETLTNSDHEEISLNDLATTSPANSRNLARKRRARRYFPIKPAREPTFSNVRVPCTSLRGEAQMKEREFRQHRGRQRKKEIRRQRRQQSELLYGRQYNTTGSAERTGVSESAGCVGEHEPTNFEKYLANIRILQDALLVSCREPEYSESDKENFSPHEKNLEIHVPPAERQQKVLLGDTAFAVLDNNSCEPHRTSFPYEDGRRLDKRLEAGEGPSRPSDGHGERLIDVNRVPDDGEQWPSEIKTWVELFRQLNASEKRCQSLLEDNDNLRQLNLSLKDQLMNLVENYKAMMSENASLLETLRSWRNQELDRILDACSKLI